LSDDIAAAASPPATRRRPAAKSTSQRRRPAPAQRQHRGERQRWYADLCRARAAAD